jgi:hypothetical protein
MILLLWVAWLFGSLPAFVIGENDAVEVEIIETLDSSVYNVIQEVIRGDQVSTSSYTRGAAQADKKSTLNRPSKKLPSFENGGVIFFLHVPKTGGTTIRLNVQKLDRVDYHFGKNYSTYWDTAPLVEDAILHGTHNRSILFLEIHAKDSPSLLRLRKRLKRWRDTAAHNKVSVFFFTVLRDSLPYALSHFNFFHVQKRNPTFEQCNATEENFLRLSLSNPQCQFLANGEPSMRAQKIKDVVVQPEKCEQVYETFLDSLDWVGTTERLNNETLPLMSQLLQLPSNFTFFNHRITKKEANTTFEMQNLSSTALNSVLLSTTIDTMLYERALRDFPFSSWDIPEQP